MSLGNISGLDEDEEDEDEDDVLLRSWLGSGVLSWVVGCACNMISYFCVFVFRICSLFLFFNHWFWRE